MRQSIAELQNKLKLLEKEIVFEVFAAIRGELDGAIEAAYYDGLEDGKKLERENDN